MARRSRRSGGSHVGSLFGFLIAVAVVAAIGAWVTLPQIPIWYHGLVLPSWTPPDAVFGPAWTALYLMIAVAAWGVARMRESPVRQRALSYWWIQLAANCLWSPLFFGLHLVIPALIDIVLLVGLVVATVLAFRKAAPWAATLLLPYLAWLCYATSLNAGILILNR